ncbi:MAG: YMGG-like glycine zipper-containing protein [Desulfobacterales bacterium]|nr:YMGG-like glycine zipper-containing protein [Desulfobacterales bacterium]
MKKIKENFNRCLIYTLIFGLISTSAFAEMIIFPAKGQTPDRQQKDEAECRGWAVQNTGIDPVKLAQQPVGGTAPQQGGAVKGAARGALVGVVAGAIAGDAGKGAAIGAGVGATGGALKQRSANQGQQQADAQAQQDRNAQMDTYNRAVQACLEGKGYTVK